MKEVKIEKTIQEMTLYECENCGDRVPQEYMIEKCPICGKEICNHCSKDIHTFADEFVNIFTNYNVQLKDIDSDTSLWGKCYWVCKDCKKIALEYEVEYYKEVEKEVNRFHSQIQHLNKAYLERIKNERDSRTSK